MNLKQLEYFVEVANSGNISVAGKKLHMSQPPLSRQIQLLEEEIGTDLLIRGNKGIRLTEAGSIFYEKAISILRETQDLQAVMDEAKSGLQGTIRIGICYSTFPIIMEKMKLFLTSNPNVRYNLIHAPVSTLADGLYNGEIDMLFLRNCHLNNSDLSMQFLEEDALKLVMHKNMDSDPGIDSLEISALRTIPLCVLSENNYPGHNNYLITMCKTHGFLPNIICECYDTSAAMALALSGIAATFQPESIIRSYAHPDLSVKSIRQFEASSRPVLIWYENRYLSACARNFISLFVPQN